MVTKLSERERKSLIERFQQRLVEGIPLDQNLVLEKMAAHAPRLPEDPTPEQLDAWLELAELMSDASFRSGVQQYFARQDPRKTRYWQLVSVLNAGTALSSMHAGWGFVASALRHHLPAP